MRFVALAQFDRSIILASTRVSGGCLACSRLGRSRWAGLSPPPLTKGDWSSCVDSLHICARPSAASFCCGACRALWPRATTRVRRRSARGWSSGGSEILVVWPDGHTCPRTWRTPPLVEVMIRRLGQRYEGAADRALQLGRRPTLKQFRKLQEDVERRPCAGGARASLSSPHALVHVSGASDGERLRRMAESLPCVGAVGSAV